MWYYLLIILIAAIGILFTPKLMAQVNKGTDKKKIISSKENFEIKNDSIQPLFSKAQIEEKLKYLAETPPPTNLSWGAMCYRVAILPDTISYICPVCGERTAYSCGTEWMWETTTKQSYYFNNSNSKNIINAEKTRFLQGELNSCRREIQKVKGVNIFLDESEFCKHCSPFVKNPTLYLLVNIGGESDTTKISNVSYEDIQLIRRFLNGELVFEGDFGIETPLVNHIERIKELLGLKNEIKND